MSACYSLSSCGLWFCYKCIHGNCLRFCQVCPVKNLFSSFKRQAAVLYGYFGSSEPSVNETECFICNSDSSSWRQLYTKISWDFAKHVLDSYTRQREQHPCGHMVRLEIVKELHRCRNATGLSSMDQLGTSERRCAEMCGRTN